MVCIDGHIECMEKKIQIIEFNCHISVNIDAKNKLTHDIIFGNYGVVTYLVARLSVNHLYDLPASN